MLQPLLRKLLKIWIQSSIAPGYAYYIVERYGKFLAKHALESVLPSGSKIMCLLTDEIQRQIYFFGMYEPIEAYLFSCAVTPEITIMDIGANIGQYTLLSAPLLTTGKVHSFEPIPSNFNKLQSNIIFNKLQDKAIANQLALSDFTGEMTLYLATDDSEDNSTNYSINRPRNIQEQRVVHTSTMTEYWHSNVEKGSVLGLIKLDAEGCELPILKGGSDVISQFAPIIMCEINRVHCEAMGYHPNEIFDLLSGFGYRCWLPRLNNNQAGFIPSLTGVDRANVFFVKRSLPERFQSAWDIKAIISGRILSQY